MKNRRLTTLIRSDIMQTEKEIRLLKERIERLKKEKPLAAFIDIKLDSGELVEYVPLYNNYKFCTCSKCGKIQNSMLFHKPDRPVDEFRTCLQCTIELIRQQKL